MRRMWSVRNGLPGRNQHRRDVESDPRSQPGAACTIGGIRGRSSLWVAMAAIRTGLKVASAFDAATGERGLDAVGAAIRTATGAPGPLVSHRSMPRAGAKITP